MADKLEPLLERLASVPAPSQQPAGDALLIDQLVIVIGNPGEEHLTTLNSYNLAVLVWEPKPPSPAGSCLVETRLGSIHTPLFAASLKPELEAAFRGAPKPVKFVPVSDLFKIEPLGAVQSIFLCAAA